MHNDENKNKQSGDTRHDNYYASLSGFHRAVPIILTAVAVFIAICLFQKDSGIAGDGIARVLKGLFSYGAFAIPVMIILHSFFYAEDVAKKRVLTRAIFSLITVLVVSSIEYTIVNWSTDITFTPGQSYTTQANGGFVGTVLAFGIVKVIGPIGLIIVALATMALYLAFFFANSDSTFGKFTLTVLTAFASIFAFIEKGVKKIVSKIKNAKAERERRETEKKSDELLDDSFFDTDNGMSELKIKQLDISDKKSRESAEHNPTLQHSVHLKSHIEWEDSEDTEEPEIIITKRDEPHVRKKHELNLDYGIEAAITETEGSTEDDAADDAFENTQKKATANRRDQYGIDASADTVFNSTFDPFDFEQAERAASKVSSKFVPKPETRGIKEISEPIDRLPTAEEMEYMQKVAAENAEKAKRLEAFERRKRELAERARQQSRPAENAVEKAEPTESVEAQPAQTVQTQPTQTVQSQPVQSKPAPTVTVQRIIPEPEEEKKPEASESAAETVENIFVYQSEESKTEEAPVAEDAAPEVQKVADEPVAAEEAAGAGPASEPVTAKPEPAEDTQVNLTSLDAESEDIREIVKIVTYGTKAMNDEPAELPEEEAAEEVTEESTERIERLSEDETDEEIALRIAEKIAQKNPTYLRSANEMHTYTQIINSSTDETASKSSDAEATQDEETATDAPVTETESTDADDGAVTFEFSADSATDAEIKEYSTANEAESVTAEFKEFATAEETLDAEADTSDAVEETLTLERTMLSPAIEVEVAGDEAPEDVSESDGEIVFTEEAEESDEQTVEDTLDVGTVFTFESDEGEDESLASVSDDAAEDDAEELVEIPPEEQNPDVLKQREMFPFLNEENESVSEPEVEAADEAEAVDKTQESAPNAEETETVEETAVAEDEADDDGDEPPFDDATVAIPSVKEDAKDIPDATKAPAKPDYSDYVFPSIELLGLDRESSDDNVQYEIQENADRLIDTLASFNVTASIKGVDRGPRITRYEVVPAKGVKVSSIMNLQDDIALSLAADGIRMEAPIPGKSAVGVEIPNKKSSTVRLRELLETEDFKNMRSKTAICIGKDVAGQPVINDISKMPHLLIAGATGMGKSVCINALLISILYKAKPDEVKLIMIDPKQVEFTMYNGIPHLLIPVVSDAKQAAGALMWAVDEMERRYNLLNPLCVRNIDAYNEKVAQDPSLGEPMSKIVIVIDEFADLMLQVKDPVENLVMRIAQKARAAGIHLIIGTQRPSTNVITGTIKANIPSRISCKVASNVDSRTVLDAVGAEKLLNKGDMLFSYAGAIKPLRVQGAFVADSEVESIMSHLKQYSNGANYDEAVMEEIKRAADKCSKKGSGGADSDDGAGDAGGEGYLNDKQFLDAVDVAINSGRLSTALLQRKLSIGYGKAARFIDVMCDMGIISEPNGQKPREVLITADEWHEKLSRTMIDG